MQHLRWHTFLVLLLWSVFSKVAVSDVANEEAEISLESPNQDDSPTVPSDDQPPEELSTEDESLLNQPMADLTSGELQQLRDMSEKYKFEAEVNRLLDIIINSLYTNRDVFLRELVSNAADALEKARVLSLSNSQYLEELPELEIRVQVDPTAKTITIRDTGVGMTKEELIANLGTVARSGTSNFLEALAETGDINLIGQFGVGFYSAFLVADRVTVTSKHPESPDQYIWESMIGGEYTVAKDPRGNTLIRGTQVTLHLKEDSSEYLDEFKVRSKIEAYNQFINFPIKILSSKSLANTTASEKPVWHLVNAQKPIWLRPKEELTKEDYIKFYNIISYGEPIAYSHFTAEGEVSFKALIFVPDRPPSDRYANLMETKQESIKLYSQRVLVSKEHYDLLPRWLNFIIGFVDTDDLPLKAMEAIRKKIVAKFLELVKKLSTKDREEWAEYRLKLKEFEDAEDQDSLTPPKRPQTDFMKLWFAFNKNLKFACVDDFYVASKIAKFLRFKVTGRDPLDLVSLDELIANHTEEQPKVIHYLNAETYEGGLQSPLLKYYLKNNIPVLILTDPLDEPALNRIGTYEEFTFSSLEKATTKSSNATNLKKVKKAFQPLTSVWKTQLEKKVANVVISDQLEDAPAVIRVDDSAASALNDRMARNQLFYAQHNMNNLWRHRVLEINPSHPFIQRMLDAAKQGGQDQLLKDGARKMFDYALLIGGFIIDDPAQLIETYLKATLKEVDLSPDAIEIKEYQLTDEELTDEELADEETEEPSGDGSSSTISLDDDDDTFAPPPSVDDANFASLPVKEQVEVILSSVPEGSQQYYREKAAYMNDTELQQLVHDFIGLRERYMQNLGGKIPQAEEGSDDNAQAQGTLSILQEMLDAKEASKEAQLGDEL